MSRTGLSKSQVRHCRDQLLAQGRYPSVDAIRQALGNTGSKSTIHKYLKELADEASPAGRPRADTRQALHALVDQLAGRLHDDAEEQIAAMRAEHEAQLAAKDQELLALRRKIAMLAARVDQLEGERAFHDFKGRPSGFGNFNSLQSQSTSRGGRRDTSAFSLMSAGARSDAFDVGSVRPGALKFL